MLKKISKKISKNYPEIKIDFKVVSKIALLHDIGHTPYGHAGERGLHDIVSGKDCKKYGLPDFKKLKIAIGFKHNLNSGLLYLEESNFKDVDYDILDGIVKHSSLKYSKDTIGLDYGFESLFNSKCPNSYNSSFRCIEGFIVSWADKIAQMCSDYIDICSLYSQEQKPLIFDCEPFSSLIVDSNDFNERSLAHLIYKKLIDVFITNFGIKKNYNLFKNNGFTNLIEEFNKERLKVLKSNEFINNYDQTRENKIKKLFAYYFYNPEKMTNDFCEDFLGRLKRIKFRKHIFEQIY